MKRGTILLVLITCFANVSLAQGKADVDVKLDFFLTLPAHNDLSQKFDFGGGAMVGIAILLPNAKTYVTPQMGLDFMAARSVGNDDTFRESIFFTNFGVEFMHEVVSVNHYKLLPFFAISSRKVIDRYLRANGDIVFNSNGGSDLDYDKLPPLFEQSAISFNLGLENRFKNDWYIRVSYELYQPEVTADLSNSYDDIDNRIFAQTTRKLNLSTFKIGAGAYFW